MLNWYKQFHIEFQSYNYLDYINDESTLNIFDINDLTVLIITLYISYNNNKKLYFK